MYREKIRQLGSTALARHGTDVGACSLGWVAGWVGIFRALGFKAVFSLPALDRQYD